MHAHIYIQCTSEAEMKSHVSPPRPEPGKTWHGLSRNQGAVGEHDEQYQLPTGT